MTVSLLPARLQKTILSDLEGFFALKGEPLILQVPETIPHQPDYIDQIGMEVNGVLKVKDYAIEGIFTSAHQFRGWESGNKSALKRLPLGWIEEADAIVEVRESDLHCFHLQLDTTMRFKRGAELYRIDHLETYRNLIIAFTTRLTTV